VIETAHTADLPAAALDAARRLLATVFEGDFTAADWEHTLGGMHVLAFDGDELVGHAAVVQRRLLHGGRALRTGYVEGVGVRADRRRRGIGGALIREAGRIVRGGYELGALGATDEAIPLYTSLGWERWPGPTAVVTPDGLRRTPDDDGAVYVLEVAAPLDREAELACDWRDGDVW
jgi:aminoglycoside 2'-N-acetyltransferase I